MARLAAARPRRTRIAVRRRDALAILDHALKVRRDRISHIGKQFVTSGASGGAARQIRDVCAEILAATATLDDDEIAIHAHFSSVTAAPAWRKMLSRVFGCKSSLK